MSFDTLAPHYRWMESVLAGQKLQDARTTFLSQLEPVRHALLAGEGAGRFAFALAQAHPQARLTCIDSSPRMLDQLRNALGPAGSRTDFVLADLRDWTRPAPSHDLVVTHFFLDCFHADDCRAVVANLAAGATLHAQWLLSDFNVPPNSGPCRWRAQAIVWLMYRFFRLATRLPAQRLEDPTPHLRRHGFELRGQRFSEWHLLRAELWQRTDRCPSSG